MTPYPSPSSAYPGVHRSTRPAGWRVQMMHRGRRLHLGYWRSEHDAAETARLARELLPVHGAVRLPTVQGVSARRSASLRAALVERLSAYGLGNRDELVPISTPQVRYRFRGRGAGSRFRTTPHVRRSD